MVRARARGRRGRKCNDTLGTRLRHRQRLARCRLQLLDAELELPAEQLTSGANVSLTIESDPPGADARTSLGPSCRTPCMIPVPADRSFTVSYSLNGYLPQAIQVGPRSGADARCDVAGAPSDGVLHGDAGTDAQPGLCAASAGAAACPQPEGQGPGSENSRRSELRRRPPHSFG